ncbi:hypothetical protein TNCV_4360811 [Trichonephila clavipes]|nr:hypothetical protein TNCV_4360811 [Trichonephila clavipes]
MRTRLINKLGSYSKYPRHVNENTLRRLRVVPSTNLDGLKHVANCRDMQPIMEIASTHFRSTTSSGNIFMELVTSFDLEK